MKGKIKSKKTYSTLQIFLAGILWSSSSDLIGTVNLNQIQTGLGEPIAIVKKISPKENQMIVVNSRAKRKQASNRSECQDQRRTLPQE